MVFTRHIYLSTVLFLILAQKIFAQVLNCEVEVLAPPNLSSAISPNVVEDLSEAVRTLLNQTPWNDDEYKEIERIVCTFTLNITSLPDINTFEATTQVLVARPVYHTDYQSVLFNYTDTDWKFEYLPGQPLRYTEGLQLDELTGLLAFYAHLIIGLDKDSFILYGGNLHFQIARNIMSLVPSTGSGGWSQFGNLRNRYWLIDNLLDPRYRELRKIFYQYHRHGIDNLANRTEVARKHIFDQIKRFKEILQSNPPAQLTVSWIDTKYNEWISLFSEGDQVLREEIFTILTSIDPARTEKYKVIKEKK